MGPTALPFVQNGTHFGRIKYGVMRAAASKGTLVLRP